MNLEKFTDRARGFLQSAQTVASRMNHQRIAPIHVLKALLEDEQGMAAGLIARAGGSAEAARRETDEALAKMPVVSGSGASAAPSAGRRDDPRARPAPRRSPRRRAIPTSRSSGC